MTKGFVQVEKTFEKILRHYFLLKVIQLQKGLLMNI